MRDILLADFIFFSSRRRHTRYWRDWSSDVCSSDLRLGDLEGRAVAAARNALRQDDVDAVAREDEAGDAADVGNGNGNRTHARPKRRGQEAALARLDQRALGDRLAGGDLVADHGAEQVGGVGARLTLHEVSGLDESFRPGLELQRFRIANGAHGKPA